MFHVELTLQSSTCLNLVQTPWPSLAFQVSNILMRTLCPASLTFRERLARAIPAKDVGAPGVPLDWSRLAAAETTEALAEEAASKVEINSGGYVAMAGGSFFSLFFFT